LDCIIKHVIIIEDRSKSLVAAITLLILVPAIEFFETNLYFYAFTCSYAKYFRLM